MAGIWPLVSLRNAEFLANEVPGVSIPPAVLERMRLASAEGRGKPRRGGANRPRNAGRGPFTRAGGSDRGPARPGAGGAGGPRPSLNALRSSGIFPPDPRPRLAGRNPMTELTTAPLPITTLTEEEEMFRRRGPRIRGVRGPPPRPRDGRTRAI